MHSTFDEGGLLVVGYIITTTYCHQTDLDVDALRYVVRQQYRVREERVPARRRAASVARRARRVGRAHRAPRRRERVAELLLPRVVTRVEPAVPRPRVLPQVVAC